MAKKHFETPRYYKRNSSSVLYIALWPDGTSTSIYNNESKISISRRDEPQTTAFLKFYGEQLSPVPESEFVDLFHKTIASLQDDIYKHAES
ncbi:hypothetical protein G7051_17465 [Dysgonomonas sp. HDW5B]|uniref:hypothetical protein n=1 Tax=Dysgonomonas sp. HDW5B TaxID=2714927 RepID=UPI00140901AF|nr:hypothetical protein [Dysgonomonas sp. HDW5B]QIK56050.1 hypothetical protein G7051_17465 [Dysgonomonas sp. HDW5B]